MKNFLLDLWNAEITRSILILIIGFFAGVKTNKIQDKNQLKKEIQDRNREAFKVLRPIIIKCDESIDAMRQTYGIKERRIGNLFATRGGKLEALEKALKELTTEGNKLADFLSEKNRKTLNSLIPQPFGMLPLFNKGYNLINDQAKEDLKNKLDLIEQHLNQLVAD